MKAIIVCAAACLGVAGASLSDAAIRNGQDMRPGRSALLEMSSSALFGSQRAAYNEMLMDNGIELGSSKARLIIAWIERFHRDPAITGNGQQMRAFFLDSQSRSGLIADGLARLAPSRRLQYVRLINRFLDTLVPANCFGLNDMSDVVNHLSLNEMSEADIDEYFPMLLDAIRAAASNAPLDVPTPQQSVDAQLRLRRALMVELGNAEANVVRYQAYMENPSNAAPDDACWAIRVTMHAILAMPEPYRDVVLRNTVSPRSPQETPGRRGSPTKETVPALPVKRTSGGYACEAVRRVSPVLWPADR
ncbi:hypothetical protein AWB67_07301 [Caballeronia terrestris]|jgi:hypothetical protein|uniref:Uncharacterized protein n=1 Tax=Caballeronia terrestris TaxID=1226301 RepID=A0A158L1Q1_9BURK|nr:hypothetical protein [Caballeronia terrestris]SAL86883.1 hypothetical protein AWB67_07301 [Caballeronia terrestris]